MSVYILLLCFLFQTTLYKNSVWSIINASVSVLNFLAIFRNQSIMFATILFYNYDFIEFLTSPPIKIKPIA